MSNQRKILKSWKEIATYLGVGIRTAQRWTLLRGLPVRRPGASRGTVLGVSDEIDRWLRAPMRQAHEPLEDMVATDLLTSRPARPRQLEREVNVLLEIGTLIARKAEQKDILRRIATMILTQCKAESAGFSILDGDDVGQEIFRWTATCGRMEPFEAGTTPATFSPCGLCLERNSPQLFHHPELFYRYLTAIAPIAELLLIPMHNGNEWVGTIWVISHTGRRKFDAEDARLLLDLGELAGAMFVGASDQTSTRFTTKATMAERSPARRASKSRRRGRS
jgi:hypothetical protein